MTMTHRKQIELNNNVAYSGFCITPDSAITYRCYTGHTFTERILETEQFKRIDIMGIYQNDGRKEESAVKYEY